MSQCNGNGSRTGTNVSDTQRLIERRPREQRFDQVFRLRTRNQNVACDSKCQSEELLFAKNVLDGLMRSAAFQPALILRTLLSGKRRIWVCQEKSAVASDQMQ